ncbi:DHA2 family efflux MFS transporter permease subunit [Leucobacter sp. CSA1]|uniref:DHA2 family efflux MFS transporter permease subunit n=1 Tax=Leucobacter chromiisoli TaxID=2796471 RepID=A0A934Q762_9MICO|nr:DHA2 family efflux MFS transporter permease subunit [Leucobacter chromiisoli]MBK0418615.1 DHA2 family efflux MFS transporter permease subunit [Leucobacter chromiisoli]
MPHANAIRPWAALWSLVIGFFMILVDTTIVSVANPSIMRGLGTTMTATLWATSAYLLAYAVPLLITGRLGDRFGPRRIYLFGLSVFTLSSLACGLAGSIEVLVGARVLQGFGAAMMTPQTMAVITRIFPPRERGSAMAVWGVTAGVATLVGPILGGFLLDAWGWEWIFFINVPVGVIAFALALRYVPRLETSAHRFDWLGVLLSALGMFLLVFGIQEGESFDWGVIWGPISVWSMIGAGVVILIFFVVWQRVQRGEPLIPLRIFRDRNFSVGTAAIVTVGLAVTSMGLPLMFYLQLVRGLTPTQSALMMVPMAVLSIALARPVGRLIDRRDPRRLPLLGLLLVASGLLLYFLLAKPDTPIGLLLIPSAVLGFGNAFMWGPLASITTFGLEPRLAGAGSGVYNTSRQVGSVLGSAAMAALMESRLTAQFGEEASAAGGLGGAGAAGALPEPMREGFTTAMAQSILMPMAVILVGAAIVLWFAPRPEGARSPRIPEKRG